MSKSKVRKREFTPHSRSQTERNMDTHTKRFVQNVPRKLNTVWEKNPCVPTGSRVWVRVGATLNALKVTISFGSDLEGQVSKVRMPPISRALPCSQHRHFTLIPYTCHLPLNVSDEHGNNPIATLPVPELTTTSSYLFRPRVLNLLIIHQNWVFMILFNPFHSKRFQAL